MLTVSGLMLATGCGDDDATGEDVSTTVTAPTTSSPVEDTGGDSPDSVPLEEPPAPDPSTLPEAVAPAGLGVPELPADAEGVVALLEALPDELLGATREIVQRDPGTIAASYDTGDRQCSGVGLQAVDLTADEGSAYPEGWRAEDLVALFASGVDWDVEDAGHEAARFWVTFETYCGGEQMEQDEIISSAAWGDETSPWVFFVGARNTTERDVLLTAFVDAALAVEPAS